MHMLKILLYVAALVYIAGCNGTKIDNPLPEFRSVSGPTGPVAYLDFIRSNAVADLKGWSNTDIYFRYATSENEIKSTASTELTNVCPGSSSMRDCSALFPNAWDNGQLVFPVGTSVFYQWFIDYRLPGGNDVATIESDVNSFTVVAPQSCVFGSNTPGENCPAGELCVRDPVRADPVGATLAPTVCRVPEPA